MAEYVTKEDVIELLTTETCDKYCHAQMCKFCEYMLDDIEAMKSADVQEVKRGEWEIFYQNGKPKIKCTNCHSLLNMRTDDKYICIYPKFCEECGADMRNVIQNSQELIYKKACGVDVAASIEAQKSWEQWRDNVRAFKAVTEVEGPHLNFEQDGDIEQKNCTNCKWYTVLENHLKEDMPVCRHEVTIDHGTDLKVSRCVFYEPKEK